MKQNLALLLATLLWGYWGFASKQATNRAHFFTVQLMVAIPWAISTPLWYLLSRRFATEGSFSTGAIGWALSCSLSGILAMLCFVTALRWGASSFGVMLVSIYPVISLLFFLATGQERLSLHHLAGAALVVAGLLVLQMAPR